MRELIHLIGLGFEQGQSHPGLSLSSSFARPGLRALFEEQFTFLDEGDFVSQISLKKPSIHRNQDLQSFDWSPYQAALQMNRLLLLQNRKVLNWGGDHSLGLSTVGAFTSVHPSGSVLWIDAHADLNLPSASLTGSLHGMPLALTLNLENSAKESLPWLRHYLSPDRLIYLGLRDLDPFEKEVLKQHKIYHYTFAEIRDRGMPSVANEIYQITKTSPLHVSFDIDSMDPQLAPSTGVPVSGGLRLQDLRDLNSFLFSRARVTSVDVAEVNPLLGAPSEVELTYQIAFRFLRSVFNLKNDRAFAKTRTVYRNREAWPGPRSGTHSGPIPG